ncbi:MAG: hypothetical protein L0Y66_13865, partial [Myxococcaceae bacterium]|nr:hypothetical protein [Myxococcaceae bacterium]
MDGLDLVPADERLLRDLASPARLRTGAEAHTHGLDLERDSVLAIVAHGVYVGSDRRPAHVALAPYGGDDGLLGSSDLEAGGLPPLVLLLTCQAAN